MVLIRSIIENLSNSQNFIAPDKAQYAFIFAYDNTQGAFCQDFYAANLSNLSSRLILRQDGVQPQLPRPGQ